MGAISHIDQIPKFCYQKKRIDDGKWRYDSDATNIPEYTAIILNLIGNMVFVTTI